MDISKYWKTIVDTLQDGVMVVDPGGKVLSVNPAAEQLTGYKRPRHVEFRDELPKSNVGKILRRELRDEDLKKQET